MHVQRSVVRTGVRLFYGELNKRLFFVEGFITDITRRIKSPPLRDRHVRGISLHYRVFAKLDMVRFGS